MDAQPPRASVVIAQHDVEVAIWQADLAGPCGAWMFSVRPGSQIARLLVARHFGGGAQLPPLGHR